MSEGSQTSVVDASQEASDSIFKIGINLAIIGLVAGAILSVVNYFTQPIREANEVRAREMARKTVLPKAASFTAIEGLDSWFYGVDADGQTVGYIVPVLQRGYDGNIVMTLGVDKQFKVVRYKVLKDRETPGLGAKMKEDWFIKQFTGRGKDNLKVSKVKVPGKVTAITGATITSKAVAAGIKAHIEVLEELAGSDFKTIPAALQKKEGSHE